MAYFKGQQSGQQFSLGEARWQGVDNELLDISGATQPFDPDALPHLPASLWRYKASFPFEAEAISMGEGFTPLTSIRLPGLSPVDFKLDYLFPSGSYKDRGATVLMSYANMLGVKSVVQDSSGNAGCAVAHYAALAGMDCEIFVPAQTSPAKLIQIEAVGATVNKVPGSREDTAQAAMKAAKSRFYASHVWQPMFFQGTKTFAYEICEQRGWQAPDTLILPAGNGTLLIGAYIGFQELKAWGIIDHIPKLIGIQAAHCAPLAKAVAQGFTTPVEVENHATVAEGIAIAVPRRGAEMIRYVQETGGKFISVEEAEIAEALRKMCHLGYFIEPTSAAVVAGVIRYMTESASPDEQVASVLTGHGLKAAEKIGKILRE